jgi:hypothetical protein
MVYKQLECSVCGDKFLYNADTDGALIDCVICGNDTFLNIVTGEIVTVNALDNMIATTGE